MRLVNKHAIIGNTFCLETTELECYVGTMLQHLVTARCCASYILEDLSHQTVATAWVSCVNNLHLFLTISSCVAGLITEEHCFFPFIPIDVFRSEQAQQVIQMNEAVGTVHDMLTL